MTPWKQSLAGAVRTMDELLELLQLTPADVPASGPAADDFALRVPREFVRRMRPGDPRDPLLLQVLPAADEMRDRPGFTADPLGEQHVVSAPGVLVKYRGRLLVMATGACAVHCRYCFRRHFPYGSSAGGDWRREVAEVASHPECEEVILSGGDPLILDDGILSNIAGALAAVPQLRRLRLHSRVPVVIPSRVDDRLLSWLTGSRLQPVMVIHANHANEIDHEVLAAMGRLRSAGVTLLNQSVLLRGVNDSVSAVVELSERLFEAGVLPYYLHLLDRVRGAAHFEVPETEAVELTARVRERLPGYLVPRLVREIEGAPFKQPADGPGADPRPGG